MALPVYAIVLIAVGAALAFCCFLGLLVRCCVGQLIKFAYWAGAKFSGLKKKGIQAGHMVFDWSYLEGGSTSKPTLVFVHGFSANKESWLPMTKPFVGDYHVIIPDLTGHGETYPIEKGGLYTVDVQVDRLKEFLDATVGADAQYHMIGTSMGGWITGLFTHRYPKNIISSSLLCPAGLGTTTKKPEDEQKEENEARSSLLAETPEDLDRMMSNVAIKKLRYPRFVAQHVLDERNKYGVLPKIMSDLRDGKDDYLTPDILSDIQTPMLVIWGDKDKILDCSGVGHFERDVLHVETRIIQNCGHAMLIDAPTETTHVVKGFIDGVSSGRGDVTTGDAEAGKLDEVVVGDVLPLQQPLLEEKESKDGD